jgi:hypothetical protein
MKELKTDPLLNDRRERYLLQWVNVLHPPVEFFDVAAVLAMNVLLHALRAAFGSSRELLLYPSHHGTHGATNRG